MLKYDSLYAKWYKISDFEWLDDIVKFILIMAINLGGLILYSFLKPINLTSEKLTINGSSVICSKSKMGHVEYPRLHLMTDS